MKKYLAILFFSVLSIGFKAHELKQIDSIKTYLKSDIPDSLKIKSMFLLSELYTYQDVDSAIHYSKIIKRFAEKIKDYSSIGQANIDLGWYHYSMGNYNDALNYYFEGLRLFKKIGDERGEYVAIGNLGNVYRELGDFNMALKYNYKYLNYVEPQERKSSIAVGVGNIGLVYYELRNLPKAEEYIRRSLKLYEELEDKYGIARNTGNLALIYDFKKEYKKALYYYQIALELDEELNNKFGVARHYGNIGILYRNLKNFNKAEEYLLKAMELDETLHNKTGIARHLIGMAQVKMDTKAYADSEKCLKRATDIAHSIKHLSLLVDIQQTYTLLYSAQNKHKEALNHYRKFYTLEDSLRGESATRLAAQHAIQIEYNKQMIQDSLDNAKAQEIASIKIAKQKAEIDAKKIQQLYMWLGIGLILLFTCFIFNRFRVTISQKKLIEEQKVMVEDKNKEITDSINYAKRIQNAILPPNKVVKEHLQESFILYKPKDIVAGDFYWLEQKDNKVLFAAADCTGHGVPGAMVSVVCNNGLNRSVREYGLTDPGKILDKTREIVVEEFEKSEEEVKDGMDIALCSLEGNNLQYAGAHNPLWIIRNGELLETKANKQPIGKFDNPEPYTTHTIELQKGDSLYIFSDGYADQFGGEKGKKLKTANFKKLLLSIQKENMQKQKELIDEAFEKWKGKLEQLDDVCVIGLRI